MRLRSYRNRLSQTQRDRAETKRCSCLLSYAQSRICLGQEYADKANDSLCAPQDSPGVRRILLFVPAARQVEAIFSCEERRCENAAVGDTTATRDTRAAPGFKRLPPIDADLSFKQSLASTKDFAVPAGLMRKHGKQPVVHGAIHLPAYLR